MQAVFLFSLAAAFLFSIGIIFDKFILENRMPNALSYFFLQSFLAMTLFPLFAFLFFGVQIPSLFGLLLTLFSAIAANSGFLIYFLLVKNYDLSSVGPLIQTKLLFAIPLAFLFLQEFYGVQALLMMALIFVGAILSTYSKGFSAKRLLLNNRLLLLALLMSLTWAFADLPTKVVVKETSAASFMAWRYLLSIPVIALFALLLFKGKTREQFSKNLRKTLPFSLTAAVVGFLGLLSLFTAYGFSYTIPSAVVLSQAIFVFAVAFAISRIKRSLIAEKQPLSVYAVRLAGVLLIISSIYFLMNQNLVP